MKRLHEKALKKIESCKGDDTAAKELLANTKKELKSAKNERKAIVVKLLKIQNAATKLSTTPMIDGC